MANLITRLRAMTNTGTAEYTVGTVTYWDDSQLQDHLDAHRTDIDGLVLKSASETVDGATIYRDYYAPFQDFEEASTGSEAWAVLDASGSEISTDDYVVNYVNGHIRFNVNTGNATRTLRGRSYDMNRAAAQVWRQKAAHVADRFDVKTDNHSLSRSQLMKNYLEMARQYEADAGVQVVPMRRSDLL
jgi:hypothetical protein